MQMTKTTKVWNRDIKPRIYTVRSSAMFCTPWHINLFYTTKLTLSTLFPLHFLCYRLGELFDNQELFELVIISFTIRFKGDTVRGN